jgi:hypothetical protein
VNRATKEIIDTISASAITLLKLNSGLLFLGCAVGLQALRRRILVSQIGADTGDIGAVKEVGSETERGVIYEDTALRGAGACTLGESQAFDDASIDRLSRNSNCHHC